MIVNYLFLMKNEIEKATECDTMNIIENSQCLSRSFTRIVFIISNTLF